MSKTHRIYSVVTARLNCLAGPDKTRISRATGFFLNYGAELLLVTNDHVVSGLGQGDRKVISKTGARPQWLEIVAQIPKNQPPKLGSNEYQTITFQMPLYRDLDCYLDPVWLSHPKLAHNVDIAIFRLNGTVLSSTNRPFSLEFPTELPNYQPMDRVFVIGYPLDTKDAPNSFPIYKSASVASEPDYLGERPYILIDSKTKPGMSGSPIILVRSADMKDLENGTVRLSEEKHELIGVYSGRQSEAPNSFEAELGLMWPIDNAIKPILETIV